MDVLEWSLIHGPHQDAYDKILNQGMMPSAYENVPELYDDLLMVWDAWMVLHASRTMGFSAPNPIQLSEIRQYLDIFPFPREDALDLVKYIQKLDSFYFNFLAKKNNG